MSENRECEKPFKCNKCYKCFPNKCFFIIHQTHNGEKPFICNQCDDSFANQSTLVYHQSTHDEEKSFKCDHCGKCLPKAVGFKVIREHTVDKSHLNVTSVINVLPIEITLVRHHLTHSGEKPFTCYQCDECFIKKSSSSNSSENKHTVARSLLSVNIVMDVLLIKVLM